MSANPCGVQQYKITYKLLSNVFTKLKDPVTYEDGDGVLHEAVGETPHVLRPGGARHHALPVRPGGGGGGRSVPF